jgi:hypothetical protein
MPDACSLAQQRSSEHLRCLPIAVRTPLCYDSDYENVLILTDGMLPQSVASKRPAGIASAHLYFAGMIIYSVGLK